MADLAFFTARHLPGRLRLPALFDADWYRSAYPDLQNKAAGSAVHWLRHGRHENRHPCHLPASEVEAALWSGQDEARVRLEALAGRSDPRERIWAWVALARLAAAGEDWAGAQALLSRLDTDRDLGDRLGMPGPLFLAAEVALRCGDRDRARRCLGILRRRIGAGAECRLFEAALLIDDIAGWRRAIAPVFEVAGLVAPGLTDTRGRLVAFDRLSASAGAIADGPLVSVVMAARNAGLTIDTAVESLTRQSWRRLEILIVENGSGDDTAARARGWAERDSRVRLLDGSGDPGTYAARNLGVSQAAGDFITFQDADDWTHPERIARQVAALVDGPAKPASMSFWVRMSEGLCPSAVRPDVGVLHPNLSSLMIRRDVIERAGYWDRVRSGGDTEYVERMAQLWGPQAVEPVLPRVPLAFGRVHAGSLTRSPATGLTGGGAAARAAYLSAFRAWHRGANALYLDRFPDCRPFEAPSALALPSPARTGGMP